MRYEILNLIILGILSISTIGFANAQIAIDPASISYNDNGNFVPYKLTQNSNTVSIYSGQGSYVFNKNTCTLSFYNSTSPTGSPIISSDSYSVIASQGNTGIWNPVSIINNAACTTSVTENNGTVSIIGTKSVTGAGVFSINYTKLPFQPLKLSFSATNNNPSWTNYHIGLSENLQVPQIISLGDNSYDLSQYNNTVLNRNWLASHNGQLIKLAKNLEYNTGIGWNHVNQITIHWINNQANLQIDYNYNTPIISPGQTITIDPSITLDAVTTTSATSSTNATQTISVTVGSNTNRAMIVGISLGKSGAGIVADINNDVISSVKIGTLSFTKAVNKTTYNATQGYSYDSELWYLINPPTGSSHVTITPSNTNAYTLTAGAYSLYNTIQSSPIGATATNSSTTRSSSIAITPTHNGAWLIENIIGCSTNNCSTEAAPTSPSGTQGWSILPGAGFWTGASQYVSSPSIGSSNKITWQWNTPTANRQNVADVAIELLPPSPPTTPTITKVNTLNSTAINGTWNKPTGTAWFWFNATLSGGATTHINTTKTTITLNNYTAGSRYTFSVIAANATGKSPSSITKFNYTTNISPTSPVISSITNSEARVTVTNPSGNFSGYKIYDATPNTGTYVLAGTSSNTTNHFDFTGLLGNQQYITKLATRYAVGTNYTGVSSNSTTVSWYTLPNPPTGLTASQTIALIAHLSWTTAGDNGTQLGYKIEQSTNGGVTWAVKIANTTNSTTHADITESSSGNYKFRVSSIKYAGTSSPSNVASVTVWNGFLITIFKADNVTSASGNIYQSNSTSLNNIFSASSGSTTIGSLFNNQNFTFKDSATLFLTKKQYNINATSPNSLRMITYDFFVDCGSDGTGTDFEWFTNGTTNHRITAFSSPICYTNNTVKWKVDFTANGNSLQNDTSSIRIQVLNNTFGMNPTKITANGTTITSSYAAPWIISNAFTVANGVTNAAIYFSANMALNPAYVPTNYTAGSLNVTGSNNNIQPIQISSSTSGSNTVVTFTYPTTYTLGVTANMLLENKTASFSNLTRTTVDAAHVSSSITFKNATNNDVIKIKAFDIHSNNNANYSLAMNSGSIPILTQIANFRNGTYGTHGQFGSLDLIILIVLIFSMIGLNRVSETVGLVFNLIVIGGFSFYGILPFDKTIFASIAMIALIIVGSTKKLPWS